MTREHLFPAAISNTRQDPLCPSEFYLRRARKYFSNQPTIRDVCARCNNGSLSMLDAYGDELYDGYFGRIPEPGECVRFEYDYDRLLRWILKLLFNSARIHNCETAFFSRFRNYILGHGKRPRSILLFLQLISPHEFTPNERILATKSGFYEPRLDPEMLRITRLLLKTDFKKHIVARAVSLQAFMFQVLLLDGKTPFRSLNAIERNFVAANPHTRKLTPERNVVAATVSKLDALEAVRFHFTFGDNTDDAVIGV
jgi:hypothetical protein